MVNSAKAVAASLFVYNVVVGTGRTCIVQAGRGGSVVFRYQPCPRHSVKSERVGKFGS
jgi:hypothetical protein